MPRRNIPSVIAVSAFLLLWQLVCSVGLIPSYMLPSPIDVMKAFVCEFPLLWENSVITLQEAFAGLILGVGVGFIIAVLMDSFDALYKAFYPLLIITQTIPSVAIAPLLVLWFGYEMTPKIVLIVISTFFPVTVGLLEGFKSADRDAMGLLRSMGGTRMQIFRYIKFPSALPQFFSGLKIAAAYSVVGAVISEWLGGFGGLGVYMTRVKKAFAFDKMFAVIFLISAISLALMALVEFAEKKSMPYRHSKKKNRRKSMKKIIAVLLVFVLIAGFAGCGTAGNENGEKITVVLDWTPNTNHTGIFVAIEKGYFEDAGLNVEVVQPPEDGAEALVASGKAQFGVSFQDSLAPAFAGENPLPITAVAAVIQHNTSGIVSRAGEGMESPKGLEGKKYATWDLPAEKATIREVMAAEGGNFDLVELIPSTVTDEVSALKSGSVDAIWIFYGWAGVACEVAGLETDYFEFADIDPVFDYYTPVIIGNNTWLSENPETAKAFMEALSKGYTFAAENPKAAADILMDAAPELKANSELVYASQEYLAAEYVADADRWGEFDGERWSAFFSWLNENGLIEGGLDPDFGFTNEYLPR